MTIRVLVIDDQPQLRTLVRRFFAMAEHDLEVAGEAGTAQEALEVAAGAQSDVAVVDANLPDRSGVDLAIALRAAHPDLRLVLFTGHVDPDVRRDAEAAGIDAVVLKDAVADLADTIVALAGR